MTLELKPVNKKIADIVDSYGFRCLSLDNQHTKQDDGWRKHGDGKKAKKVGEHQMAFSDKCIGQFQSSSKNATDK